MAKNETDAKQALHIISMLVEDKFGVLQRISGVFSRRGFNMDSLTVGATTTPGVSRMTITTRGTDERVEQIVKQLSKLVETLKVSELSPDDSVSREIALVKVSVKDFATRSEVLSYADIFRARVVDVAAKSLTIEITGESTKVDAFIDLIKPFGIKEVVRTGICALQRD
ncbi:Small subunit of acetolactate synthase [Candidatus Gugararchaeum adminiculabundum]|nr:Small subunit of acetolactate synthase [Candidatus Gugararchaeum adminiculabundum]